jgi:hypothetical protein
MLPGSPSTTHQNPFDLIQTNRIDGAVIEVDRARRLVIRT